MPTQAQKSTDIWALGYFWKLIKHKLFLLQAPPENGYNHLTEIVSIVNDTSIFSNGELQDSRWTWAFDLSRIQTKHCTTVENRVKIRGRSVTNGVHCACCMRLDWPTNKIDIHRLENEMNILKTASSHSTRILRWPCFQWIRQNYPVLVRSD